MRTLTGLCFLTATLLASSANAQSMFIDKGDPSTVSVTLGGHYGGLYGGSLNLAYSYRGVFDVGLDTTGTHFTGGDLQDFNGVNVMPFIHWHAYRSDADEAPISISFLVGVEKVFYTSSAPYASPSGWGVVLGGSLYRRFELGTSMFLIPELLLAYDYMDTRTYHAPTASIANGYSTDSKHSGRAVLRVNLGIKAGGHVYTVTPYAGYQGSSLGSVVGMTVGLVF
jgi:hypothetical protein